MATAASTAWDILSTVVFLCVVASLAAWIVGWLRGQRTVRDEHGRLKPVPAVLARFAALIAIALLIALVDQWRS